MNRSGQSRWTICAVSLSMIICTDLSASGASPHIHSPSEQLALPGSRPDPPYYVPKKPGRYTATDWQAVIDSTWGPGMSTSEKMTTYLNFWNRVDDEFACYQGLDAGLWDSIRVADSTEVAGGVSRGRFCAILNHACLALKEFHTWATDNDVPMTSRSPGVPLMVAGGWYFNDHFGAALTPMPDSSLFVYKVVESHPLGLELGDQVLGYDGVPWKNLYRELLDAELPLVTAWVGGAGAWWGGSEPSSVHSWLVSAGRNWHLFDTIDVVKYATGDTLHLSTDVLDGASMSLFATEQLDVPGVPQPTPLEGNQWVSWGIIDGTQIGYIYVWGWPTNIPAVATQWLNAVDSLMNVHATTGLIIDLRTHGGGWPKWADEGFELLFDTTITSIRWAGRSDPEDHLAMGSPVFVSSDFSRINGDPATFYAHPIAVLTGPGCASAGDVTALQLSYHRMTKFFGKTTAAMFSPAVFRTLRPGFWFTVSVDQAYLGGTPRRYLDRVEFPGAAEFPGVPHEEVWLTPDNVVLGTDDVVEAARAWILSRDVDQDGAVNESDNCLDIANSGQENDDLDIHGNACDNCPAVTNGDQAVTVSITGDTNLDSVITSSDIIYKVNFVFKGGFAPQPCEGAADVNCDGSVTASDTIGLVNFVFKGGTPPCDVCQATGLGWACP